MANPSWPATIPQNPLLGPLKETPVPNKIDTQMDIGVPKSRRRYTKELRDLTWVFVMTTAEVALFDTFYHTTLEGGTLPFDHVDSRTGVAASFRIKSLGEYNPLSGTKWSIPMEVTKLP